MDISALFIRIFVLALPGLVGSLFYRTLRGGPQQKDWRDLAEITFFALLSYALYGAVLEGLQAVGAVDARASLNALQALFDEDIPIRWGEVVVASLCGVVLAIAASYADTYKLVNRFGQWIKATKLYGDEDVWSFFHNSPDTEPWVFVRDHKLDLVYYGWIGAFSESESERELLLRDVQVYSNTTDEYLYDVDVMYVARERHDFTIEVPAQASSQESGAPSDNPSVSR